MRVPITFITIFLGFLIVSSVVGADLIVPSTPVRGLEYVPIGNITHDTDLSYTKIHGIVENTGFEKVFISLPKDWEADTTFYHATGEPVIVSSGAIRRKYGNPKDRYSFISNFYVFWQRGGYAISKGSLWNVDWNDGSKSVGWYLQPNERMTFDIKMKPSQAEAIIDPFDLEQNRSDIKVLKWNQEFIIYPDPAIPQGFLPAPWIVKNAALVEATPGIYGNISAVNGTYYYNLFKLYNLTTSTTTEPATKTEELHPPAWNEWFSSSPGLFSLNSKSLAPFATEFLPIPELNKTEKTKTVEPSVTPIFIPVWAIMSDFYVSDHVTTINGPAIRYRYEWKRNEAIASLNSDIHSKQPLTKTQRYGSSPTIPSSAAVEPAKIPKVDLTTVPEWYAWF